MTKEAQLAELFKAFDIPQIAADQCPLCGVRGQLTAFENVTLPLEAPGGYQSEVEGLCGTRCLACDEMFMDAESSQRFTEAGDALVIHARQQEAQKLKAARLSLGLTQHAASTLTGGGHNAFHRYETGQAVPVPAVSHLMNLLAKHPELGREIPGVEVVEIKESTQRPSRGKYKLKVSSSKAGPLKVSIPAKVNLSHHRQTNP